MADSNGVGFFFTHEAAEGCTYISNKFGGNGFPYDSAHIVRLNHVGHFFA